MYECGQPRADRAHDVQLLNAKTYTHADGCSQNGNTPLANLTFLPGPPATFPEQSRKKYHGQSAESEQWVLLCVLPQSHHLVSYGIQNIPPRLPVARHTWYPCSRFTSLTLVYTCIYRCSECKVHAWRSHAPYSVPAHAEREWGSQQSLAPAEQQQWQRDEPGELTVYIIIILCGI